MTYCILFGLIFCFFQSTSAGNYHHARRIRTYEDGYKDLYIFETVFVIGIRQCVEICKTKTKCRYINYRLRMNMCSLIGLANNGLTITDFEGQVEEKVGYIFANMIDWNKGDEVLCEDCNEVDKLAEHVRKKDGKLKLLGSIYPFITTKVVCPIPEEKKNARFLGNMYTVGSKILYTCDDGLAMNTTDVSRTTCNTDGTWSRTTFKCLPKILYTGNVLKLNHTYFKLVTESMTWNQAKEYCGEHGGYLADILSQQEQDIATELASNVNVNVWIGGIRYGTQNHFLWLDQTPVESSYMNWYQGQPYHAAGGTVCMNIIIEWNYRWNDASCSSLCGSICKIKEQL